MGRLSFDKKLNSNQLRDLDDTVRFLKYKNHRVVKNYIKVKYKVNTSITAVHRYMQNRKKKDIEWLSAFYVVNPNIVEREIEAHGYNHTFKDTNGILRAHRKKK
ncbi:hypothetical protein AA126_25050 [Salmonella enterica]|uniref:Uncharacterized protein n=1 Tax=Salmonella enterica TaxID=28901 RepID=A0A5U3UHU0_SALER|nr:hypothetical protein [Salmonella enterica]ECL9779775.1 hypothetical protein [Salmonella enterica subsp. enterica serovar Rubislaw]EBP6927565.1 hypothetical protein [Salmonella enterica]EBP7130309.1 hypothetical protein [Salmonella enterica]EBP8616476.1 hypothetical protein [Salmonella enterica]